MATQPGSKSHRTRKNPRSAELWAERKKAINALRPKQAFDGKQRVRNAS